MAVNYEVESTKNIHNIILFCIAFLLSAFGYEFLFFILTVYAYDISHKAVTVGFMTAITFFPKIFSPFYGIIVDRYDRKKVLGINAGIVGLLIIVLSFVNNINLIYAVWLVASFFIMLIMNARTVLMTEIFSTTNYLWGNSLVLSFLNIARILAPLLAGLVMVFVNYKVLFIFASIIYFLCMFMSLMIQLIHREKIKISHLKDVMYVVLEGMRFIWEESAMRTMAFVGIIWRLFLGLQYSLFIVYVTKSLGQTEVQYGYFMTVVALGSLAGSFVGLFINKKVNDHVLVVVGLSLHFISFLILGMITHYSIALILIFISYSIFYVTVVGVHSLRDRTTQVNIRGRVYGSITSLLTPPAIISMLLGGLLADIYGVQKVLMGAGLAAFISLMIVLAKPMLLTQRRYVVE